MENLVMVLEDAVMVPISARTSELKKDVVLNQEEEGHSLPLVRPYHPPIPFSQRVARAKLSKLEHKFGRFLDVLRWIYVNAPSLEALKETLAYV